MKQLEDTHLQINPVNVWLVEDNLHYQKTLTGLINNSPGMVCTNAFTACEEALSVKKIESPPHVILLDIGLPGMSGIQGIEKFKELFPTTHIIILTVYDDSEKVFAALCEGASGYLLKDSAPEKIISSIREVLIGGVPMNMQIAQKVLDIFARLKPKKSNYGLTDREKELLQYLVEGLTKQQIAEKLFLSFHTVNTHIRNIYDKLQVHTRSGAISKVYKENLL